MLLQELSSKLNVRLTAVRQSGKEEEENVQPDDSWTAEASTAGQRAIHLGCHHKGWAVVPPTGLQRSVAAASAHLNQKLAVWPRLPETCMISFFNMLSECYF